MVSLPFSFDMLLASPDAVRPWSEVATGVKLFMLVAAGIIAGAAVICRKRKLLVWVSSKSNWPTLNRDPFISSPFFSPKAISIFRVVHGLWCCFVIVWMVLHPGTMAMRVGAWSLYTTWNYTIITVLSLTLGVYGLASLNMLHASLLPSARKLLDSEAGDAVRGLMWTLYQQQLPTALIVSIVYWSIIWPQSNPATRSSVWAITNGNQHLWNSVYMLFEFACLNEMPIHLPHAVFMLGMSTLYLYWSVFRFGFVPSMSFLDLASNLTGLFFFFLCLVHFAFYALAWWAGAKKTQWLAARLQRAGDGKTVPADAPPTLKEPLLDAA